MAEKTNIDVNEELDEDITVELELENGEIVNCAIVTILTVEKKDYIALLPMVDEEDENYGEVWFYEYIEDEEEYENVADAFDEFLDKQEYDELIEDEEDGE